MSDPLEDFLRAAPLNDRQRAGLWDMYEASKNADDLAARLKSMELPEDIKAGLWDLKSQGSAPATEPKAATWSDRLGLNSPNPQMPQLGALEPLAQMVRGGIRGAGAGAVDMVQGAASSLMGTANAIAGAEDQGAATAAGMAGTPYQPAPAREMPAPDNLSGTVGTILPDVAMSVMPVGVGVAAAKNALPSTTRAGKNFETVLGAAKDITVDVGPAGDRALRLLDLQQKGEYLPKPVSDFLKWVTSPKKAPLAYKDSRDFASSMSKLTTAERLKTNPKIRREVTQMAAELNLANANAAKAVGKGAEYKAAMREYANAMRMLDAVEVVKKRGKQAAIGAAGLGAADYWLRRD